MRYEAEQKGRTRERVLKQAAKAVRTEGPRCLGVVAIRGQFANDVGVLRA